MTFTPEPYLSPTAILDLRPTQMTVGMLEVKRKREHWEAMHRGEEGHYLGQHLVPVVVGPSRRLYLIDNHHLALSLHEEGIKHVLTNVLADLAHLPKKRFWTVMERFGWSHPFDAKGKRQPASTIPKSLTDLKDDPYRSLAGEVRRCGGYAKTPLPYAEFLWADHLRDLVPEHLLLEKFDQALADALRHARGQPAKYLPGWCGSEGAA